MTITTEHLIAAAKAIGIEINPISPPKRILTFWDGSVNAIWNPEHDKTQLMDLQWKLKMNVAYLQGGNSVMIETDEELVVHVFDNTFESFAAAIIIAAAEIGRGME